MTSRTASSQYRWLTCGLLFLATTINYFDRQILSLVKPLLDTQLGWTNEQFGAGS
jgi:MFS transporter, ACS family, hexuronate transporter